MPDHDTVYPGSRAAKAKGCICPASDGIRITARPDCPLHGLAASARAIEAQSAGVAQDQPIGAHQKGRLT